MRLLNSKTVTRFAASTIVRGAIGLVSLGLLATGAGACAAEQQPVSRVQPNAIKKSIFVRPDASGAYRTDSDVWYSRATIVDVPASSGAIFIGAAGDMSRIRWKIDENYLIAYKDDPDVLGTLETSRGMIAAFKILSHFDVRRAYNTATGEEQNIIEENESDRPWFQREYMRVDWATNEVSKAQFVFPGIEDLSAAGYFVQDPKDKDFPIFSDDYVDVTGKYSIWADTMSCFLSLRQQVGFEQNCGPAVVSMRLSFMKVPKREFVPREYPDRIQITDNNGDPIRTVAGTPITLPAMDQFGYFRTERAVYDPRFGSLEKRYLYRANTWNIWQEWFQKKDGEVQYEAGKDGKPDTSKPKLLPYKERKVRPIVYFLNAEWPTELRETADQIGESWNDAFQETVAGLRLLEEKGAGSSIPYPELRARVDAMKAAKENVFVLCKNNPVKDGDPEACGKTGDIARLGDQRYSFLYWVPKNQFSGPLGFGPSYADPITGEIFSAGAHIYGAALDTYSQWATDVVNLLNGKFKGYDYINGVNTDLYVKHLNDGDVPGAKSSPDVAPPPGTAGFDLARIQGQIDKAIDRPQLSAIALKGFSLATGATGAERMGLLAKKPLGQKILAIPEMKALLGKAPDAPLADGDMDKIASLMLGGTNTENDRLKFLGTHGCYYAADFADDATIGIAKELAERYAGTPAATPAEDEAQQREIWMEIRKRVLRAVSEHEVGHTLGLRHNFEGSSDALNFHDDYWKLRGPKPKYGDPMTQEQQDGKMVELEYSTVMDYGSRFNSDIHGVGKYDRAAIRFGYGNIVEAWPAGKLIDPLYKVDPAKVGSLKTTVADSALAPFAGYSAEILDAVNRNFRHYTQIPSEFSDGLTSVSSSGREIRKFEDVAAAAREIYIAAGTKVASVKTGGSTAPKAIDVVPYRYCGDEYAGSVNRPLCERWDRGSDQFEIVKDTMDRYRSYYVFDAFSRGKTSGFALANGYINKMYSRYFARVTSHYQHWMYYQGERVKAWQALNADGNGIKNGFITNVDWYKDPAGGLPGTVGTYWGLDRLTDVLANPDVGTYVEFSSIPDGVLRKAGGLYACGGATPVRCASSSAQAVLDIDDGVRYRQMQYDGSLGSSYYLRIKMIGSFYDWVAALTALTKSSSNFIGVDKTNALAYQIDFFQAYPRALTAVIGGIASDTRDNYAWRYDGVDTSKKTNKLTVPDVFATVGGADGIPKNDSLKGKPVDAQWYISYKNFALFYAMANWRNTFSQSFNDAVRVWCTGCGEGYTPGPGVTTVSFTDPLSGKIYSAVTFGDGRFSPGSTLIKKGQDLVKIYDDSVDPDAKNNALADIANHVEFLDVVRGLYSEYGMSGF